MEYISAEEFLKQPSEVQGVFIDWWNPSIGDLFIFKDSSIKIELLVGIEEDIVWHRGGGRIGRNKIDCIPLLTEGQLRKFIEHKTKSTVYINFSNNSYYIGLWNEENMINNFRNLGTDLLQAYWQVACQIASKED